MDPQKQLLPGLGIDGFSPLPKSVIPAVKPFTGLNASPAAPKQKAKASSAKQSKWQDTVNKPYSVLMGINPAADINLAAALKTPALRPVRGAAKATPTPGPRAQPRMIKDATGITRVIGANGKAKYFLPDHTPTDAQTWQRATYALGHDDPAPTPGDYFKAGVSGFGDIIGANGRAGTLHQMGSGMAHGIGDITAPYVAGAVQYGKEFGNRTAGAIKAGVALGANGVANTTGLKGARQVAANEKRAAMNSFTAADRHQALGNADVDNGLAGINRATPGTLKDLATAGGYYAGGDAAAGTHTLKQIPANYLDALQNDTPNALMTFGATILPVGLKGAMGNALRMEARSAALSEQSAARAAMGDARGAAALQEQADLAAKQAKQSRMLVDVGTGKALVKPVQALGKSVIRATQDGGALRTGAQKAGAAVAAGVKQAGVGMKKAGTTVSTGAKYIGKRLSTSDKDLTLAHLTSEAAEASIAKEQKLASGKYEIYALDKDRVPVEPWKRTAVTFVSNTPNEVTLPQELNKYFKPVPVTGPLGFWRRWNGVRVAPPGVFDLEAKTFQKGYMRTPDGNIVKMPLYKRVIAAGHQAVMSRGIDAGLNAMPPAALYYWYLTHQNDDQNAK